MKILIVEDEQIVAADLQMKLGRLGHHVVGSASTGEEAIEEAKQKRPQVVLMDVQLLGGMDGIEAAAHIQQATGAPVVFLTAYAGVFIQDPTLMRSPGLCLSKPFSLPQLQAILEVINPTIH